MSDGSANISLRHLVPERYARYYLEHTPSLVWLVFANAVAVLVGARFYVDNGLSGVSTFLWPLFADSPTAVFFMTLSVATLLPNLGSSLDEAPHNRTLAYLHTIAFVWLVKYGLWTAYALNLDFNAYFPEPLGYFGIIITHLAFVAEAFLIPHYGRTTRGALVLALALMFVDDFYDYAPGFGHYPHLKYTPGIALIGGTIVLSVLSVFAAHRAFDRL